MTPYILADPRKPMGEELAWSLEPGCVSWFHRTLAAGEMHSEYPFMTYDNYCLGCWECIGNGDTPVNRVGFICYGDDWCLNLPEHRAFGDAAASFDRFHVENPKAYGEYRKAARDLFASSGSPVHAARVGATIGLPAIYEPFYSALRWLDEELPWRHEEGETESEGGDPFNTRDAEKFSIRQRAAAAFALPDRWLAHQAKHREVWQEVPDPRDTGDRWVTKYNPDFGCEVWVRALDKSNRGQAVNRPYQAQPLNG